MAFGPDWGVKDWDDEAITSIIQSEIDRSWRVRGIGDFAVGLRRDTSIASTANTAESHGPKVLDMGEEQRLEQTEWVGYVGVRDATTTSMLGGETHHPTSRPWVQMIELRYGYNPDVWGKGYGMEAARAIIWWCEEHIKAQRFIAETQTNNLGSGKILRKCGFTEILEKDEVIWGVKGEQEWELWAGKSCLELSPTILTIKE
ncbi:hypothetical protein QM012_000775 [Aureobasidium pullulans]|uniref:N-acetyltransferase domain-containing protein n=1 Tax=Aureobasidium pullulans TaxID=5580 RepID=A0ABR0TXI5_AURPU